MRFLKSHRCWVRKLIRADEMSDGHHLVSVEDLDNGHGERHGVDNPHCERELVHVIVEPAIGSEGKYVSTGFSFFASSGFQGGSRSN